MRKLLPLVCLGQLLWFIACGDAAKSPLGNPPRNPSGGGGVAGGQVQGSWYAALTSTSFSGSQGEVDLFIRQTGNTLSAAALHAYSYSGVWCLQGGGAMTGTVSGSDVVLTIRIGAELQLKLTGTLSNGALTGTYTTIGPCGNGDEGNFTAQLQPPITSSLWIGTALFPGGSADFTADLAEDSSGQLTGSLIFSNSTCVTALNITGSHWGRLVTMTDTNGIVIDMWGSIDASSKAISGYQLLGGSACGFDTYTMSRP